LSYKSQALIQGWTSATFDLSYINWYFGEKYAKCFLKKINSGSGISSFHISLTETILLVTKTSSNLAFVLYQALYKSAISHISQPCESFVIGYSLNT
jgi:hypothetical protein